MDHPDAPHVPAGAPPSAAELGISEEEYARIRVDLRRRRGEVPAAVLPPAGAASPAARGWLLFWVVLGLVAVVALVRPDGTEADPAYAFLEVDGDRPVTYSSCRPLRVAVYPAGGPPDAEELVREAVASVREATGLDVVVTGSFGGHAPNWNFEAAPIRPEDPVSVSWQDGDALAQMTDDVAGLGGSPVVASPYGGRHRVAGTIALSRDYFALLHERGARATAVAVIMHEFGHVLGLDHVDSSGELMAAGGSGAGTWGPGDLAGLRLLGQGPCL